MSKNKQTKKQELWDIKAKQQRENKKSKSWEFHDLEQAFILLSTREKCVNVNFNTLYIKVMYSVKQTHVQTKNHNYISLQMICFCLLQVQFCRLPL